MTKLTGVEERLLQMLLRGDDEVLYVLRQQAGQAWVSSRNMTGTGFFTNFEVPAEVPRVKNCPTFQLGDVHGTADNVKHGLGFLLFVKDGVLSVLEGYTYDEAWPDEISGLVLTYSKDRMEY